MKDPIGISVELGKCSFYSDTCAWFPLRAKLVFENGSEKLYKSRFALPARDAFKIADEMNKSVMNDYFSILDLYLFISEYGLFELVE